MALQRFVRRVAEAANGTGEAKDALAQMGIALRDQSGHLRRSEDLLGEVADAFTRIEDPAERVRLAFKLFDSEGVALVNLLQDGSGALEEMRERARSLGIVLDEHLVRDAGRARDELDALSQVISANLTRAALEAAPVIADLSNWFADVGVGEADRQGDRCDRNPGQDILGQPAAVVPRQRGEPGRKARQRARMRHAANSDHRPGATVMRDSEHSGENVPTPDLIDQHNDGVRRCSIVVAGHRGRRLPGDDVLR